MVFGGEDPGTAACVDAIDCRQTGFVSFKNISIYDPYIDVWFAQQAAGQIPSARSYFCAIAVQGHNNTYEMSVEPRQIKNI